MWYYELEGAAKGPISAEELLFTMHAGRIGPASLVWREGMSNWLPLHETELSRMEAEPPALPAPPQLPPTSSRPMQGQAASAGQDAHLDGAGPNAPGTHAAAAKTTASRKPWYLSLPIALIGVFVANHYIRPWLRGAPTTPAPIAAASVPQAAPPAPHAAALPSGVWVPDADGSLKRAVLSRPNPGGSRPLNVGTTIIDSIDVPWLPNSRLIRVRDTSWPDQRIGIFYVLDRESRLYRLDGTSPVIHTLNAAGPIRVTNANVISYLKFFTFFVRGEDGPFLVIENPADGYPERPLDAASAAKLQAAARPVRCSPVANGNFDCSAVIFYSNVLFDARFSVMPSGMIEMPNSTPVATGLSSKPYRPIN